MRAFSLGRVRATVDLPEVSQQVLSSLARRSSHRSIQYSLYGCDVADYC